MPRKCVNALLNVSAVDQDQINKLSDRLMADGQAEDKAYLQAIDAQIDAVQSEIRDLADTQTPGLTYSRGFAGRGMSLEAAQQAVVPVREKWVSAPPIDIIAAPENVPADAKGMFHGGTAYLFHDRLFSYIDAQRVLLHEVVGHFGMARLFGDQMTDTMLQIYSKNQSVRKEADKLTTKYRYSTALATEEALANMAYDAVHNEGLFSRLAANIRSWLRSHGFSGVLREWSDSDVYALLKRSHESLFAPGGRNDPVVVRHEDTGVVSAVRAVAEKRQRELGVSPDIAQPLPNDVRRAVETVTRRGVQTWKETETLAAMINENPFKVKEHLSRAMGDAYNSENLHSFAEIMEAETNKTIAYFDELDMKIRNGQATDEDYSVAYERSLQMMAMKAQFFGARAEAGRALQIFRKLQNTVGRLGALEITVGANEDVALARSKIKALAYQMAQAKYATGPGRVTAAMQAAAAMHQATNWEKFFYSWRAFMVSNPASHFANIGGNALVQVVEDMSRILAAGLGKFHTGEKVTAAELSEYFHGYVVGLPQGLAAMGESFMTEGEHSATLEALSPRLKNFWVNGKPIKGVPGKVIGMPFRFLGAEDAFFKGIVWNKEFAAVAKRKALARGQNVNDLIADLQEREAIDQEVSLSVSKQLMQGPLGNVAKAFRQAANSFKPLWLLAPFLTVSSNILGYSFRATPIALAMPTFHESWKAGGATRDIALSRMILGTGITVLAFMLGRAGLITGAVPEDEGERNVFYASGKVPNALKIGDKWYQFNRLDPFGSWLSYGAEIARVITKMHDVEAMDAVTLFLKSTSHMLQSKLWLSGIMGMSNAFSDPERYGKTFTQRLVSSFVPFGGLSGAIAKEVDPIHRRLDSILDGVKNRIPGAKSTLLPKLDIFGREVQMHGSAFLPVGISEENDDRAIAELERLDIGITQPRRSTRNYKLTPEEHNKLIEMSGERTRRAIRVEMANPRYRSSGDEQKKEWLEDAIKAAHRGARQDFVLRTGRIQRILVKKQLEALN